MDEILNLILPAIVIGLGATLQVSVGYGYGLVAVPLLILINPDFVPAPFIFVSLILMLTVSIQNRNTLAGKSFSWVFIGLLARPFFGKSHQWYGRRFSLRDWAETSTELNDMFSTYMWISAVAIIVAIWVMTGLNL